MKVFLSYQRADTAWPAHGLFYALERSGHKGFVDTGDIGVGQRYREVIANAVATSNLMLALVGPSFRVERLREPTSVIAFEWQHARSHGTAVVPLLIDGATMPTDDVLPPQLRWFTQRNALTIRPTSLTADIDACIAAVPTLATEPRRAARVLWVDDNPANNEAERKELRSHGIVFDNVVSTDEAIDQLTNETYDLVITDLGRTGSSDRSRSAGAALLRHPVISKGGPPVIVYAASSALVMRDDLISRGARDVTASRTHFYDAVLEALGRTQQSAENLER